jgi:glucose-6-phosphate isomerase
MVPYKNKAWKEEMAVRLDLNHVMARFMGEHHGVFDGEIESLMPEAKEIHNGIKEKRSRGELPFMDLPDQDVKPVLELAKQLKKRCESFVVLGIGGSALGNIAVHGALNHPFYNQLSKTGRKRAPRIYVMDNVDPDHLAGLLDILDLKKTCFNVITKSGGTAETMSNFLACQKALIDAVGREAHADRIVVTTDAAKGNLKRVADREGYPCLVIPDGVGGRFSVLTPVGLLSAALSGVNIRELLAGASFMERRCRKVKVWENPAYFNAAVHHILNTKRGKHISVMMPYSNALYVVADWYRQLWAESLGKRRSLDGREVFAGQTPVKSLGTTDQHSQIQLYVEGPNDKVVTFLAVEGYGKKMEIPESYEGMEGISYLGGHTLEGLIQAERMATEYALTRHRRPNLTVTLKEINPFTLGQLFMLYEIQTVFSGGLYRINPLNQPGVEDGKVATYALMGRPGYESQKEEVGAAEPKDDIRVPSHLSNGKRKNRAIR